LKAISVSDVNKHTTIIVVLMAILRHKAFPTTGAIFLLQ
jgi:hypothetical protein